MGPRQAALRHARRMSRWSRLAVGGGLLVTLSVAALASGGPGISATAAVTLSPTADAYVTASTPKQNFGSSKELHAAASPDTRSYLKFKVTGVSGAVQSATLRLYANTASSVGVDVRSVADTSWSENAIKYSNAPAVAGTVTGSSGPVTAGSYASIDVTGLVSGNGTFGFAVTTTSALVSFGSREATNKPQLVIQTATDTTPPTVTLTAPANGSRTNSAKPSFAGAAGTAPGDLTSVTVRVYQGTAASGTPMQTLTANVSSGSYQVGASAALTDGTYTAQAQQKDSAGNTGTSSANTFTVDTAAPTATITSSPANPTTSTSASFSFTASEQGSTFACALDGAAFVACTSPQAYSGLGVGSHTFQVRATDQAANTGAAAGFGWTITGVDTTPPAVTLTAPLNAGTVNTSTPKFSGGAGTAPGDLAAVTVKVYAGAGVAGSPVQTLGATASGGAYQVTATSALADGTYTAQAVQQDSAGNTGTSNANTFTIDTAPPAVTLVAPANGGTVSTSTPTFSGGAGVGQGDLPAVTVKVYAGSGVSGSLVQTLSATASGGAYQVTATSTLAGGTYTAQAVQQDAAGNSGTSTANTFTISTGSSPTYQSTVLSDGASAYWRLGEATGSTAADAAGSSSGTYVGGVTRGVSGAISGDSNTAVKFDGVNGTVKVVSTAALNPTAALTLEAWVNPVSLPATSTIVRKDAQYLLRVLNTGAVYFRIWKGGGLYDVTTATGVVPIGAWSHVVATFNGATLTVYVDGVAVKSVALTGAADSGTNPLYIASSTGSYDYFPGTVDEVAVYARALSAAQVQAHYTLGLGADRTPPAVTLSSPVNGTTVPTSTPFFTGGAGVAPGDLGTVTVNVYAGSAVSGSPVESLQATVASSAYQVAASPALANGVYTAQAVQQDAAGNTGTSAPNTFTISAGSSLPCGFKTGPPATYQHVIVIMMENKSFGDIVGNTGQAPFENQLAGQCGLAANYHGVTHPSLPN